jgi:hypothetical protein
VLEESGEKTHCKGMRIPYDEAVVPYTPRNNMVCCGVIDDVIGFGKEWWRACVMESLPWLRRRNIHRRRKRRTGSWKLLLQLGLEDSWLEKRHKED